MSCRYADASRRTRVLLACCSCDCRGCSYHGAGPQNDISAVDNFHAQFSAYQPRPGPGPMYSDVDSRTAMEFLSRYPEVRHVPQYSVAVRATTPARIDVAVCAALSSAVVW